MKGSGEHWIAWGQYVAVVGAYAMSYDLALHLSASHWLLTAGLRLSCLLLVPTRYWTSLAIGEFLPLVENALLCMDKFSPAWAVVASVPTIALYMAWMIPMRGRWTLYEADGRICMRYLLSAAVLCALTNACRDTAAVLAILMTTSVDWGASASLTIAFSSYLLGAYLGALTVTPAILALYERACEKQPTLAAIWQSPLFRDTAAWAVPALAALAWSANVSGTGAAQQAARLAMIVPVLVLAYRHGWHGAAVGGAGASIAIATTSQIVRDPAVIHCQVVLALALSIALSWGSRAKKFSALPPTSSDSACKTPGTG